MISLRQASARALGVILAIVPLLCASSSAEQRRPIAEKTPFAIRAKAMPNAATAYSIVDDGAPSGDVSLENSVAINNTGQIAGFGYDSATNEQYCLLFDGKEFLNLSAWTTFTWCTVYGLNDESAATGSLDVVGSGTTVYSGANVSNGPFDVKAVLLNVTPKTGVIRTEISPDDESVLSGVIDSGEAVGYGPYSPITGFAAKNAPLFVAPGKTSLAVLQPSCTTVGPGCGAPIFNPDSDSPPPCGFAGCEIAPDGTMLLLDIFTGAYELVSASGKTTDVVLDADVTSVPLINAQKKLVYSFETLVAGVESTETALYTIASATAVTLPPIAKLGCTQYVPISFNNVGQVLGTATGCLKGSYQTYFLYDPATGTHDVASEIPAGYFSLEPRGVNDQGDILVDLEKTSGGPFHWGYLKPTAATSAKVRAVASVAPAGSPHEIDRTVALANAAARIRRYRTSDRSSDRSSIPNPRTLGARAKPGPAHLYANAVRANAASYTIVDYGAPSPSSFLLQNPTAFNDTGQIVGVANYVPYTQSVACVVFDGSAFRNLKVSTPMVDCSPDSINDENPATGTLSVVGDALSAFSLVEGESSDEKAFISHITPKSGAISTTLFAANDSSTLVGINASGLAIGGGLYLDRAANEFTTPAFVVSPGANSLTLLQPSCALKVGCVSDEPNEIQECPFGGCEITSDGSIFLNDVLVAPNGSTQLIKLDVHAYRPMINNAKQIMYQDGEHTEIYQLATGTLTSVPQIPGSSCGAVEPLSFNDAGTVLGYTENCTKTADYTYFIYDPKNGTRNLIAELPSGNASVTPVGINNNGQILVGLTLANGIVHWGVLKPITAQKPNRPITLINRV